MAAMEGREAKALELVAEIIDSLGKVGPHQLVVLDTLSKFAGVNIDADNYAAGILHNTIDRISEEQKCSIMCSHHLSQSGSEYVKNDSMYAIRGATAVVNEAKACFILRSLWSGFDEPEKARITDSRVEPQPGVGMMRLTPVKVNELPAEYWLPTYIARDVWHLSRAEPASSGGVLASIKHDFSKVAELIHEHDGKISAGKLVEWKTFGGIQKTAAEDRLKRLVSCQLIRNKGTQQKPEYSLTDIGKHSVNEGWEYLIWTEAPKGKEVVRLDADRYNNRDR